MSAYRYLYIKCDQDMAGFANRQLHPLNGQAVEFEIKREPGNIFFRTTLKTSLFFIGPDYSFLKSIDAAGYRCAKNCLTIQKFCGGEWVDFWSGKFSFTYFKVNDDDCRIEFTPDINDQYTCLLEDGGIEHNMLDITSIKTVISPNSIIFEYITCSEDKAVVAIPGNPCTDFVYGDPIQSGGGYIANNIAFDCLNGTIAQWQMFSTTMKAIAFIGSTVTVARVTTTWFREVRITLDVGGLATPPAGSSWINQGPTTLGGLPAHRWTRIPYGGAYTAQTYYQPLWQLISGCEQIFKWTDPNPVIFNYNRGRRLSDVISFLLDESGCFPSGFTVVSDLFRINSALTPADPDYVTGQTSRIANLILFQKSDIKTPTSSEPASKAMISWVVLMQMLNKLFVKNVYWKIYPGNVVRIEHIKWFVENQGLDTTLPIYDEFTKRTKKYSFMRQELPSIEHFSFMEQGNLDNIGRDIIYSTLCVNRDPKEGKIDIRVENLTTDLAYIQTDPTAIDESGFVMLATTANANGTYSIIQEAGALTGLQVLNAPLAWANLHASYGKWARVQPTGNMNGADTNFFTWIRTKKQDPFSIPVCCEDNINYNDLIKSKLGWGELETATFTTQTDKLKLTLLHY